MALRTVTPPAVEPVSIDDLKLHLRLDGDDENAYLAGLIAAARRSCESFQNRAYITQTLRLTADAFPLYRDGLYHFASRSVRGQDAGILLPRAPLQSVSSITYVDEAGVTRTLASTEYLVDNQSDPGRVAPAYGKYWPATRGQMNAVAVTFVAGYGAAADVPGEIALAIKMLVAHFYENRELAVIGTIVNELPMGVSSLLWQDRVF